MEAETFEDLFVEIVLENFGAFWEDAIVAGMKLEKQVYIENIGGEGV